MILAQEASTAVEGAPLAVAGFVGLAALAWKFIDWLRMIANIKTNVSGVATQALSWVGASVAVFLYGASQFGDSVNISGITLDNMDSATKILTGLVLGSTASVLVDFKQAFDRADDASKPPLMKG